MNRCFDYAVRTKEFTVTSEEYPKEKGFFVYNFHIVSGDGKEFNYKIEVSEEVEAYLIADKQLTPKDFKKEVEAALVEYVKAKLDEDYFQDSEFIITPEDEDFFEIYLEKSRHPADEDTEEEEEMEILQYLYDAWEELYGEEDTSIDFCILARDLGIPKARALRILRKLTEEGKVDLYESEIEETVVRISPKGRNTIENK